MEENFDVEDAVTEEVKKPAAGAKKRRAIWIHLGFWGLMLVYLLVAPVVEAKFFISEGKPVEVEGAVLENTNLIRHAIDKVSAVWLHGEKVYRVVGWSFLSTATDLSQHEIYLVLDSGSKAYFFPTTPTKRGDIQKAFPDITMDLTYAGFSANIAKETIGRGTYVVGFLYVDKTSGEMTYQESAKMITRTPNTLRLEKQNKDE